MGPFRFRTPLWTGSLLLVTATAGLAQTQFEELPPERYVPAVSDHTADVRMADLDGDGDADVLTANGFDPARLYLNEGDGTFRDATATHLPALGIFLHRRIGLGDIEGDGDLDALFTSGRSASSPPLLLVNDGTGHFTDETAARLPAGTLRDGARALFGDVDGDLDLDLVCPEQGGIGPNLFLNDGEGSFTDVTASRMPALLNVTKAAALADVDGDLDLDVVLVNQRQDRLYLNDGLGFFTDVTATHLPVEGFDVPLDLALADVESDGDLDLFIGFDGGGNLLRLNDGNGVFGDAPSSLPPSSESSQSVAAGDVDGDGHPDVVFGSLGQSRLYLNDGAGTFTEVPFPPAGREPDRAGGLGMADVDGDGDLDLFLGRELAPERLYLNDGTGGFTNAAPESLQWSLYGASAAELVDLDLDGDLDLVAASGQFMAGGDSWSYLNDGSGEFPNGQRLPTLNAVALATGDVDGDEDPDVLVGEASICFLGYGCASSPNELYLNDGHGGLSRSQGRLPIDSDDTFAVALGDLDGDADLDALLGNWEQQSRLYRNDGTGVFTDATSGRLPARSDPTRALVIRDFDDDGAPDIVVGNEGAQSRMYVNEGGGAFFDDTAARMPPVVRKTRALASADLDGDGHPDLVLGNDGRAGLYLNNGAGRLLDYTDWMPPQVWETWAVRLGDVDEDGDLDVVLGNRSASDSRGENRLLLNDGTARFEGAGRLPVDADRTAALALGDIDGDRDLDLLAGTLDPGYVSVPTRNRVYLNLQRQLRAPLLALLGRDYELELHAEPGYGTATTFAKVFVSLGLLPSPVSVPPLVGKLYLAPPLQGLPAVPIPVATGSATQSFVLPVDPSLVGLTFVSQAVLAGSGTGLQLTGFVRDTIGL